VLGALALTGCVQAAYVYESPSPAYYGGSYGYYASGGYYGYPGYYGTAYPAPRVVYVDHDHRGDDCRHGSHRDRRPYDHRGDDRRYDDHRDHDRRHDDRDDRPRDARGPVPRSDPPQPRTRVPPADRSPPARDSCQGKKCGSPGVVPVSDAEGEPRTPGRRRSTMRPHPADPP
jgi:hypothetical protein